MNDNLTYDIVQIKKSPHESKSLRRESISKFFIGYGLIRESLGYMHLKVNIVH